MTNNDNTCLIIPICISIGFAIVSHALVFYFITWPKIEAVRINSMPRKKNQQDLDLGRDGLEY